jgi:CRP-like cAMP-binding protein
MPPSKSPPPAVPSPARHASLGTPHGASASPHGAPKEEQMLFGGGDARSLVRKEETTVQWLKRWAGHVLPALAALIVFFQTLTIPMRLAWASTRAGLVLTPLAQIDHIADALFLLCVLFTDYVDVHTWSLRWRRVAGSRSAQLRLLLDVLSSLPYHLLFVAPGFVCISCLWVDARLGTAERVTALCLLPRLLRLPRLMSYLDLLETRNLLSPLFDSTLLRLLKLGFSMFIAAHIAGCGHFFISFLEGCPPDNKWIVPTHIRRLPFGNQYTNAVYWGFAAMTGNGSGVETPQTPLEHLFTLVTLLTGVSAYATLLGNLSGIIQQLNSKQEDFRTKMTNIAQVMNANDLPTDVQQRVKSCFVYLFGAGVTDTGKGRENHDEHKKKKKGKQDAGAAAKPESGESKESPTVAEKNAEPEETLTAPRVRAEGWEVLEYLPSYLRNEVLCHINGEIIHKVPLFHNCSEGFLRSLVPLLKPEVVIPNDYIIRTGEIGREMYLIRHGQLEVIANGVVVATLSDGSYVGEVAIVFEQKRTASVRAVTFCDILVLSKDDFDNVLCQYPDIQKSVRMQATMRRNARSLQNKELMAKAAGSFQSLPTAASGSTRRLLSTQSSQNSSGQLPTTLTRAASHTALPNAKAYARASSSRALIDSPEAETAGRLTRHARSSSDTMDGATGEALSRSGSDADQHPPASGSGHQLTANSKWKKLRLLTRGV